MKEQILFEPAVTDPTGCPFLPFARPDITDAEVAAVSESVRSGWLTTGSICAAFEREFAEFLEADGIEAVATNSATAGLHLAAEALGIGPGDEVIVPVWTFTSTAEVIRYVGATPIFVDVDPETLNLNLDAAAAEVTERTKAVMPVHFAGRPVERGAISGFCERYGVAAIEDAAHAFPARSNGRWVGDSESAATVFSFYATKTMTTGEGGMLVTKNPELARRARIMRLHGIDRDVFDRYTSRKPSWHYEIVAPGFKYNLTDPAAAMGRVQLRRSVRMREIREEIARRYLSELAGNRLILPPAPVGPGEHAWHLFPVQIGNDGRTDRDEFIQRMSMSGIGTSVHFIPLHLQPYWRDTYDLRPEDFPVATAAFFRTVSLPIYSTMQEGDVSRVIETIHSILA